MQVRLKVFERRNLIEHTVHRIVDHLARSEAGLLHHWRRARLHLSLCHPNVHLWQEVQELDESGEDLPGRDESVGFVLCYVRHQIRLGR